MWTTTRPPLRSLVEDPENLAPATIQRQKKSLEIVQEHLGYTLGEVSLREPALVRWAAVLVVRCAAWLISCAIETEVLYMGYINGLWEDAQQRRLRWAASRMRLESLRGE